MKKLYKIGAVILATVTLLICTGLGVGVPADTYEPIVVTCADDLSGQVLGGVSTRMPVDSSKIYFESLTGRKLSGVTAYSSLDEAVAALKTGDCAAVWATDVSAQFLTQKYSGLSILSRKDMAATAQLSKPRFSFCMALRDDKEGKSLRTRLNTAMQEMNSDGTGSLLTREYITKAADADRFYEDEMWHRNERFRKNHEMSGSLTIGITGAVPPLELIDEEGKPYGFCVAYIDELACRLLTDIDIEILDNETAFSSLMSGRVDALFTYGTAKSTTETPVNYITTEGYYTMSNYEFLVNSSK